MCATTALAAAAHTSVLTDTASVELREVSVKAAGPSVTRIDRLGALSFGKEALAHTPRVLGESDPMRYMRLLPGVSMMSDYSAGMSIDGMGYAQTEYRLDGIPVHFPYHFGGLFSVFHPGLYNRFTVGKSIRGVGSGDVTGGTVDVGSNSGIGEPSQGELNVGMISTSAFVRVPVGKRFSVAASGRVSYLDAIYGPMLDDDHMKARYGFGDVDVVAHGEVSAADRLRVNFHYNGDNVNYTDHDYGLTTGLKWHNLLGGVGWHHDGDNLAADNSVYFSRFANRLTLDMGDVSLQAPTAVSELGIKGTFGIDGVADGWDTRWGYGLRHCIIEPQSVELTGFGDAGNKTASADCATAAKIWGEVAYAPRRNWRFSVGLEGAMVWGSDRYKAGWADPRLSATYSWRRGNVTLHAGSYHQWLHQVGFSEMGMSSNFKIGPSAAAPVERGMNLAMALSQRLGEHLSVSVDGYYKFITDEPEYFGAVLDIINSDYKAENHIVVTNGRNAGVNLSARFELGGISAMASYGFCDGRRRAGDGSYFTATGNIRHSATVMGAWHINRHWSVSGVMNVASGRPYTPVKAIYFIGERVMMEYGARNSARLPLYHRLDLGADYEFHTGGRFPLTHRVNLSLLNAYGHRNIEMSTFTVDMETGRYMRRQVISLLTLLPSLSYSITF